MDNIDREDWLRISKSGCSLKIGWAEKRIVASLPHGLVSNCNNQWLDDAERLCDGWNELPILKQENEDLKKQIESLRNQLSTNTWISVDDRLPIYNGAYLGFAKLKFGTLITVYHFNENKKQFDWVVPKTLPYKPEVTHWMPLPPAPTHKER